MRDRFTPAVASRRHDQEYAAVCMSAHGCAQLNEHIQRLLWSIRGHRCESKQSAEQRRAVRQARAFLVDDFHLLAFEHDHVGILSKTVETTMFDHKQSWLDIFKDKTVARNRSRCSPNSQLVTLVPDAEMDLRTLYCRREFGKHACSQGQWMLEEHWLSGLFRRQIGDGDLGKATFFRPKAGPESRVDDGRDGARVGLRRQTVFAHSSRLRKIAFEVGLNEGRCCVCRRVGWGHTHRFYLPVNKIGHKRHKEDHKS